MGPKLLMSDIFTTSPVLSRFVSKVEQLSKLNRAVLKKLDPTIASHCRVANLRDGILILTTHSPIWGHKLRFQGAELLSALRTEPTFCSIKSIQSQVIPKETRETHSAALQALPKPSMSPISAAVLQDAALDIESPKLKQSMLNLAKWGVKPPSPDINK